MKHVQSLADNYLRNGKDVPAQRKKNRSGLPDTLKSGVENLSGISMDDVKVYYNSSKPAQLNAHAYAQGNDIHVAPGQEKHLPHEAWHVVQQKQGRVNATRQMMGKVPVNDDAGLEKEADAMGRKALQGAGTWRRQTKNEVNDRRSGPVQLVLTHDDKKDKIKKTVEDTNKKIEDTHSVKNAFSTDSTSTPMNPSVILNGLKQTNSMPVNKENARMTSFSHLAKNYTNSFTKNKVTPEIQTALVKNQDNSSSVYVSGNTKKGNAKMKNKMKPTLGEFYRDEMRKFNVGARKDALKKQAKSLKSKKMRGEFVKKITLPTDSSDIKILENDDSKLKEFVVRQLHVMGKKSEARIMGTGARKFSKKFGKEKMVVPENEKNFHAESAILEETKEIKSTIKQLGGTKVACLACQAFFTESNNQNLLGDYTGYAWISKSSIDQLKHVCEHIDNETEYLEEIYNQLESRQKDMEFYTGASGEKNVKDFEHESDIDECDSEDEDAIKDVIEEDDINIKNIVSEFRLRYFSKKEE